MSKMEILEENGKVKIYKKDDDVTKTKYTFEYDKDRNTCRVWANIDEKEKVSVGIIFTEDTAKELLNMFKENV